jgi:hypothetical protein
MHGTVRRKKFVLGFYDGYFTILVKGLAFECILLKSKMKSQKNNSEPVF